jgi:hypothetical protein
LRHSYFRKKGFRGFGGMPRRGSCDRMSRFGAFLFSEKRFSGFRGMHRRNESTMHIHKNQFL